MKPRIFVAQHIHSFAGKQTGARALAVAHGRVVHLGDVDAVRRVLPTAEVVDFGSGVITPGLTDAHIHITEWALARRQLDLSDAESVADCLRIVGTAAAGKSWLQGGGWNPHHWGGTYPDRVQLDSVARERPVALQSHDMHALWVNSHALELANITRDTPDPEGGRIVRDADGEPTGMLLETAAQLVVGRIPQPDTDDLLDALLDAQRALHSYGITGIHSFPGVHLPEPDPLPVLTELDRRDQLRLRVLQHISADKLDEAIHLGLRSGLGGGRLRIGGIKLFTDGALGSRTAWMRQPYEGSSDCGVQVLQRAEFAEIVRHAARHGLSAVVHAIGDAANEMAFEVLGETPRVDALPHRVEHVQCFPRDRVHLLKNGIVCSVQPCHLMTDWRAAERFWGERSEMTYAFRTMLDHGAVLACGSDAPVEPADPRLGLYAAVTRRDTKHEPADGWFAEQKLTPAEAFAGYTIGPAHAAGAMAEQGTLQAGAWADFAVWQTDPLTEPVENWLDLRVTATVSGGDIVYQNQE